MPPYDENISWDNRLRQSREDMNRMIDRTLSSQFARGLRRDEGALFSQEYNTEWRLATPQMNWTVSYGDGGTSGKSEKQKNTLALKVLDKIKLAAKPFNAKDLPKVKSQAQEYREIGLIKIAEDLEAKANKAWKEMEISLAGYSRINRSELEKFKKELSDISDYTSKRELQETLLKDYIGQDGEKTKLAVPPADVLEKLKVARESKLFDDYSVLHIKYVPDPILCGKIAESDDLYFIAEWGDDVKLTDIVK